MKIRQIKEFSGKIEDLLLSLINKTSKDNSGNSLVSLDIESSGVDFMIDNLLSLQLGFEIDNDVYVLVFIGKDAILSAYEYLSRIDNIRIIGHNLKFDVKFLVYNSGAIPVKWKFFDTMLAHRLTCVGKKSCLYMISLQELLYKNLGVLLDKEIRKDFEGASDLTDDMILYAARDVAYMFDLYRILMRQLDYVKHVHVAELEFDILLPVSMMELYGITLDKDAFLSIARKHFDMYISKRNELLPIIRDKVIERFGEESLLYVLENIIGITIKTKRDKKLFSSLKASESVDIIIDMVNLASSKQLLYIFRKLFDININSTSSKEIKLYMHSGKNNITEEQKRVLDLVLEMKFHYKRASSFGEEYVNDHLRSDGKIHARFNQLGTTTGRFSSSNPNMQQVPREKEYRHCFVASPGYKIVTADYSQMELRLMAAVSRETKMIEAYKQGVDLHKLTASLVFDIPVEDIAKDSEERQISKSVNFAVIYGSTAAGLQYNLDLPKSKADFILRRYFEGYPYLAAFIRKVRNKIWQKGYSITPFGRKRFFDIPSSFSSPREKNRIWNKVTREGLNHIIQGGSADVVKIALRDLFYNNPFGHDKFKVLLQVHDEFVVEVHESIAKEAEEFIVKTMEDAFQPYLGDLPAKVGSVISDTWEKD